MARKDVSLIVSGAGWIAGFADALVKKARALGASDEDIHRLVREDEGSAEELGEIAAEIVARSKKRARIFQFTFRGDKVARAEDHGFARFARETKVVPGTMEVECAEFLKSGEPSVKGEEMDRRTFVEGQNFGLGHALEMHKRQEEIPAEFRDIIFVFTGSVLVHGDGYQFVVSLRWDDDRWCLHFVWLGGNWHSCDRVLRSRPSAKA